MKILLDENLPKRLKSILETHEVHTVRDMGRNRKKNGELLKLMLSENFKVILTFDRNIEYQQNFRKFSIPVIILNAPDNTFDTLKNYAEKIISVLDSPLEPGVFEIS